MGDTTLLPGAADASGCVSMCLGERDGMRRECCTLSIAFQRQQDQFSYSPISHPTSLNTGQMFLQKPVARQAGDTAELSLLFPDWVMCFILFLLDLLSIM